MENARIVRLGNPTPEQTTTFDEAFGEFSEFKGRGRARRQARKLDRVRKRDERKKVRSDLRQGRRAQRQTRRQEMAAARQDRRQTRKNTRVEGRQSRKDLKSQREQERDLAAAQSQAEIDSYAPQEEQYDESQDSGYAPEDTGGGYAPQDDSGYAPQDDQSGYSEDESYSEEESYPEDEYSEDEYSEEENYDGFDGEIGLNAEMIEVPTDPQVNQDVADAARKIEWNLEFADRLKQKAQGDKSTPDINRLISEKLNRAKELNSCLDAYCNFEGDFISDADGTTMFQPTPNRRRSPQGMKMRKQEVDMARRRAKADRLKLHSQRSGVTTVEQSLQPSIKPNNIVIPAKESSSGATGIIGLDNAMDYDANATEVKLGADGKVTTKLPWKPILIGLGVGAIAIVILRKYKVL